MFVMKVLLAKTHVQVFVVASSGKPRHFAGAILCASRDRGAACADDPCEAVRAFFWAVHVCNVVKPLLLQEMFFLHSSLALEVVLAKLRHFFGGREVVCAGSDSYVTCLQRQCLPHLPLASSYCWH